jgi:ubiquinone/menaquinone biosynthesis C-methylase UbiE
MSDINQQEAFYDAAAQEKMRQVQSNFGAAAADYVTSKVHASGRDLAWLVELTALTGTEHVLDVATGGGHAAFALAPHVAEVLALDLTRPMLEVAQKEATARQVHNIRFLEGDAQEIPCADASFDMVTCRKAAHHFPYVRLAVREWARVLKPGGKLALVDSISPEEPEIAVYLNEIETLRDPSHVHNSRLSEWLALLTEAGFTVSTTREWTIFLDIPSWTQRMRTPAASIAIIEQRLRDASPATHERLHIEEKDGVLSFMLPTALIVALKTEES